MPVYTKLVDYAAKDLLLTGDPAKTVKGTEVGAEFDAIAAADATNVKDTGNQTIAGTKTFSSTIIGSINGNAATVTVADAAADTTTWPMLATSQTGSLAPATDGGLTYDASTNALTTGDIITNGTGSGLDIQNVNSTVDHQESIAGSMTFNTASIAAQQITTTVTGGAATTNARGLFLNTTYTPTANTTIANIYNQFSLNSGVSPTNAYAQANVAILGASALGGTITNCYGSNVAFSPNAAATTNITNFVSYNAANIANGTAMTVSNAFSFIGAMASGSGRWNCYMSGTANNAFAGNVRFGGITAPTVAVDVTGAVLATTSIKSSGASSGIGYATGAGGEVTQITSINTAVTLNTICGRINGFNGTYNANTQTTFSVNNNVIGAYDVVVINENGNNPGLVITANTGSGAFAVNIRNVTAGNISVQLVLNFAIIKSVNA